MTSKATPRYAVCVRNRGYAASLEVSKIYRWLRDAKAGRMGLRRVVDESGEDYLYPVDFFVAMRLPAAAIRALRRRR
ncbi:MAG TPA: hypothetical protein VFY71_12255 [Planctomycetota bacterium]|nr:hypothetical protein [Planctomycetota bacterium]